jgi:hypothetical protein
MEEVVAIAHARGIRLGEDVIPGQGARGELAASGTASILRDIVTGGPSELEEIIGAVVPLVEQKGVSTPTMNCVYAEDDHQDAESFEDGQEAVFGREACKGFGVVARCGVAEKHVAAARNLTWHVGGQPSNNC